ncbi:energy transducer TonB [Polaribacter sp.]|uniref:energy transducer TonB n=1 Tax=Polaribacter sp. TaxID=1920175 RepID=UPI0025FD60AD|nr:energy transducer TonB [Polaribacter sp.]
MKNVKKLPTKQLEKFSTIFTQLGLVLVLFVVYIILEHETKQQSLAIYEPEVSKSIYIEPNTEVIFTKEKPVKPETDPVKQNQLILDEDIEKVDDDKVETVIITEPKQQVDFDINKIEIVPEPVDEDYDDTVPFISIENAPIFKGCEGLSKENNKKCFDQKMIKFVQRNFNMQLANEIGLRSGKYRIQTQFIIDNTGQVVDIKIRAPHIRLKQETEELIQKLPRFTPGQQGSKFVNVRYTLPISFLVD